MVKQRHRIESAQKAIVGEQAFGDILAAKMNAANPAEMIKSNILGAHLFRSCAKSNMDAVQHLRREYRKFRPLSRRCYAGWPA